MNDIAQFLLGHGGPVLFAVVLVEQAGLPFPAAPWLLAAGALSATGKMNPALALGMTALACVMADSAWFYVGRRGGQRVLRLFCRMSLAPSACVGRTKSLFGRHGLQALVAAKFIPGLGTVMPPLAGALGVSTRQFLLFDGLGSLLYGGAYISSGFVFHNQLQRILLVLDRLGLSALLVASLVVPGYVAFKYYRRHRGRSIQPKALQDNETNARLNPSDEAAQMLDNGTGSVEQESAALAFTSTASQASRGDASAALAQPTPCGA